eukprot:COSAG02_NODE_3541_length_6588_cov_11.433349_3_plen_124_part_00
MVDMYIVLTGLSLVWEVRIPGPARACECARHALRSEICARSAPNLLDVRVCGRVYVVGTLVVRCNAVSPYLTRHRLLLVVVVVDVWRAVRRVDSDPVAVESYGTPPRPSAVTSQSHPPAGRVR